MASACSRGVPMARSSRYRAMAGSAAARASAARCSAIRLSVTSVCGGGAGSAGGSGGAAGRGANNGSATGFGARRSARNLSRAFARRRSPGSQSGHAQPRRWLTPLTVGTLRRRLGFRRTLHGARHPARAANVLTGVRLVGGHEVPAPRPRAAIALAIGGRAPLTLRWLHRLSFLCRWQNFSAGSMSSNASPHARHRRRASSLKIRDGAIRRSCRRFGSRRQQSIHAHGNASSTCASPNEPGIFTIAPGDRRRFRAHRSGARAEPGRR